MNFLELTKERYSTRAFSAQAVEEEKINYLLECARRAPSACNKQPWHFVVAETAEARNKVQQCYNRDWIKQAPLYIIIYAANEQAWRREEDEKKPRRHRCGHCHRAYLSGSIGLRTRHLLGV